MAYYVPLLFATLKIRLEGIISYYLLMQIVLFPHEYLCIKFFGYPTLL